MTPGFEAILPRLAATYERGRLVPFIGSGMSMPVARSWRGLVAGLEDAAGIASTLNASTAGAPPGASVDGPEALVRRANKATRRLRLADEKRFHGVVRSLLGDRRAPLPPQSLALAKLWWPLVLSTNYDNLFAVAHRTRHASKSGGGEQPIQILGRSPIDCQHVLSSLTSPSHAILWALQGFLRAPNTSRHGRVDVERAHEVVIGHQEYRAVTNREPHFRRAFAEVFRNRSLLFFGSGLSESYLLELFGEVLEIHGPSTRPNYAFQKRGEVDAEFMLARFHTVVCEYDDHGELTQWLERLAATVEAGTYRDASWSFHVTAARADDDPHGHADLRVVRGSLRLPAADECLVVGAGERDGRLYFGPTTAKLLRPIGVRDGSTPKSVSVSLAVANAVPLVIASLAGENERVRDLRNVFPVCEAIFDMAHRAGVRRVVMPLIHSGTRSRFPARLALAQIVRAFGWWRRTNAAAQLELELRTEKASIHRELASGRLDLIELLSTDDIRFWVEIVESNGAVERRLFHEDPSVELAALLERLEIDGDGWTVEVVPAPIKSDEPLPVKSCLTETLVELGVVPGSAIVLRAGS